MARTTEVLGFPVPPAVVQEVERVSREERRTKSELFREMFRVYQKLSQAAGSDDGRWVMQLIAEAKREQAEHPMSVAEMLAENDRLTRYSERQAKKLGIKSKDVDRIIHTSRARRKA